MRKLFASLVAVTMMMACSTLSADMVNGAPFGISPGLGGADGFFLATGNRVDAVMGASTVIGQDLNGDDITVTATDTNNGDHCTLLIEMTTAGTDLMPGGFTDPNTGVPLDLGGFFLGLGSNIQFADGPITPVDGFGTFGIGAALFGVEADGTTINWAFNMATFVPGGTWDGSIGVNLGDTVVGVGTQTMVLEIHYTDASHIPEPGSMALLSLAGVALVVRRRK